MNFQTNKRQWLLILFLSFLPGQIRSQVTNDNCLENNKFEYIVVGSGSSGGTIASRLSETQNVRVLLVEAGDKPSHISEIPLISFKALSTPMDWNFSSIPQQHCCHMFKDEKLPINRGKALGGSSSLNFMTYTRGFRQDYDNWCNNLGNKGWGWDDVFPYMLKLEDYTPPIPNPADAPFHCKGGPMTVEIPPFKSPMAEAFLEAGDELGYPRVDYNGQNQTGFMYPPVNTRNHSRCSTWVAYIQPALQRPNFVLESNAFVTKVLIDANKTATGIVYEKDGKNCTASATREVIISGGVIGSPKLLLLSGIGPKEHLQSLNITVVEDLPGVGQNYHDHVIMGGVQFKMNGPVTYNSVRYETPEYLEIWEYNRTGPMTCPESFEGVAYLNLPDNDTWPNMEIFFNSDNAARALKPYVKKIVQLIIPPDKVDMISFFPILLRPKSRGWLKLKSNDPHDHPLINPNLLSDKDDVKTLANGVRLCNQLSKTKAFQQYGASSMTYNLLTTCAELNLPLPFKIPFIQNLAEILQDENFLTCAIRIFSAGGYHPGGTCKMGNSSDPNAVVDNELKVWNISNLRVADASIMPQVTASHTSIPCVVIGEKAADMIKTRWGDPVTPVSSTTCTG